MTLTISTNRAEELGRWIDANLEATIYHHPRGSECIGKLNGQSPATMWYDTIVINFGGDDRVLFDMRWQGEFREASAELWRDRHDGSALGRAFHALSASVNSVQAQLQTMLDDLPPATPIPDDGQWRNPDAHIRKFKR